ncbi:MAG: hypothetical protein ACU0BC_07125 [Pseudooceanicola nanhaiensis]
MSERSFSHTMSPAHLSAVRGLGYSLTIGTGPGSEPFWRGLSTILRAQLSREERGALAIVVLRALDHDDAVDAAMTALNTGAGQPVAPFLSYMDQAAHWADLAEFEELEAYLLAAFNRMSPKRRADFLGHVQGRQAA